MKRNSLIIIGTVFSAITITSCFRDAKKPGLEYMPDMAHSVAVETYDESRNPDIYPDKMSARTPVKGTVPCAQGEAPFPLLILPLFPPPPLLLPPI